MKYCQSEDMDMNFDDYTRLINKTEDYIESKLGKQISLSETAKNDNFSEYHFHRLFSKYSSETLKQFITRIKMERSAIYLATLLREPHTEMAEQQKLRLRIQFYESLWRMTIS
jgi:AraC family transcriptional regulator